MASISVRTRVSTIDAFKRYVALAVVGGNLKRLGKVLLEWDRQLH